MQYELEQYDYGARFYDPMVGRFITSDPLSEQRNWLSQYNYVQNNPIIRVDPTGALDDYKLNKDGEIQLIRMTDDKDDKLYATDNKGNVDKDKSITVERGVRKSRRKSWKYC
ncbi:RHS repeat-associated core domain-containing protein [Pedobacter albus]|uniref:RHS repeat-associated core domain-containing protein n=1 Tax=Pedobacter albus TaxID=3113905 RepID=UPI003D673CD3